MQGSWLSEALAAAFIPMTPKPCNWRQRLYFNLILLEGNFHENPHVEHMIKLFALQRERALSQIPFSFQVLNSWEWRRWRPHPQLCPWERGWRSCLPWSIGEGVAVL